MSGVLAQGDRLTQVRAVRRIILGLIALTVLLRAPGLGRPLLGDFATKNVVYAMIARNWALGRASFFTPTLDCLGDGERAWHLLEVPLPAYLAGLCWGICGGSLDAWGRVVSVVASVASVLLLYLLARRWHGETVGRAAAAIFALAPISIVYGQCFMLEATVVALSLATIWAVDAWRERPSTWWLLLAAGLFVLLGLTKIYMLVLFVPLAWILLRSRDSTSLETPLAEGATAGLPRSANRQQALLDKLAVAPGFNSPEWLIRRLGIPCLVLLLAAVPALLWCAYALSIADPAKPSSTRVFYSLRESLVSHGFPHQLLSQPSFYAGVARNLATVVLTPVGLLLLLAGLRHESWRRHAIWLGTAALLLIAMPRKFHEMNYYYLVLLPPLCMIAALGWEVVWRRFASRRLLVAAACLGVVCSLRFAIRPAFVTPSEDAMVVTAAARIRALTHPDAWIVTMHGSSIDLLYYADRKGLAIRRDEPSLDAKLTRLGDEGAALLAVAESDFERLPELTRSALARQRRIESGPGYRLYRLEESAPVNLADRSATTCE